MKVAILGVGLIGGSIGLAARRRANAEVRGYDPDARVSARALELGAIGAQAADLAEAVAGAEVVFVAAPVGALAETVRLALDAAPPDCVVTDVGSTKRVVKDAGEDERFVGGHPLAGAETSGVEHAREDLFDGATWYLTPARGSTAGVLYERLHAVLRSFGAQPTAIDADTHDRLMAYVSHLPHVMANLLVAQAANLLGGEQSQRRLPAVGPSFRDATRVAGANPGLWPDILLANRDALGDQLATAAARLEEVRGALERADRGALERWQAEAADTREALMEAATHTGPTRELRVVVPNRPGVVAELALALARAGINISDMSLTPAPDNTRGEIALWVAARDYDRALALVRDI